VELEDMVHIAMMVERQIKRRGNTHFYTNSASSSSTWRPNMKREGSFQPKPYYMHAKVKPSQSKKVAYMDGKGKSESEPTRDRDIKCLSVQNEELSLQEAIERLNLKVKRCLLWRIVVMRRLHDLVEGEAFVIRCALNIQIKEDVD
jgi:hypothetical protein